jgi:type VI secretion system protein VasG
MPASLKGLIAKLNTSTRLSLEGAAVLCKSFTHRDVSVEHYLFKLLEAGSDTDVPLLCRKYGVDPSRLAIDLQKLFSRTPRGHNGTPGFHSALVQMLSEAWLLGSIDYNCSRIRGGLLFLALFTHEELGARVRDFSPELRKISGDTLRKDWLAIVAESTEDARAASASSAS